MQLPDPAQARQLMNAQLAERLVADAGTFARRRPWTVAVAALATGYATSRMLRASRGRH